ncbi:hypothetical protein ACFE04_015248 [Oxalis oulophora]
MGIFTTEDELSSPIAPARAFKAFVISMDELFLKVAPQHVKSVETIEGDGGVGTIRKIIMHEGEKDSYMKQKVEFIDNDNFVYNDSIIEGDVLTGKIEKISREYKIVASGNGGSTLKVKTIFYTVDETEVPEQIIKMGREKRAGVFKAITAYLLANPNAYN